MSSITGEVVRGTGPQWPFKISIQRDGMVIVERPVSCFSEGEELLHRVLEEERRKANMGRPC